MVRPRNRAEFEEIARRYAPGHRVTVIRVEGDKVSENGEFFSKDQLEIETEDGTQAIEFYSTNYCDFGHLLGTKGNEIVGKCSVCSRYVCLTEGCAKLCIRGHCVCGKHAYNTKNGIICRNHLAGYLATKAFTLSFKGIWIVASGLVRGILK